MLLALRIQDLKPTKEMSTYSLPVLTMTRLYPDTNSLVTCALKHWLFLNGITHSLVNMLLKTLVLALLTK